MRLRRFDLTRYGKFTDFSLDFGAKQAGKPDFHIIYGSNEAGKSTLRNACLDFLFGIEKQSGYGFQHPYASMRIGALVETGAADRELVRVKKDKNDLLDAQDQPVADDALTAVLGAIDRAAYETMFSLDDDSLQEGGESILKSEGDLGRLLFSAASGLSELGDIVDEVKDKAQEFFRPRGRNHGLSSAKNKLKALKDRIAEIDVQARDYAALTAAETLAHELHSQAATERDDARKAFEKVRKVTDALRPWRDLRESRKAFEPLAALPDLPEGWLSQAQDLSRDEAAAMAESGSAQNRVTALEAELREIVPDPEILAIEDKFARLKGQDLEARYISAEDIANRQRDLVAIDRDVSQFLERLGRDPKMEPAGVLLPASTVGELNDLLDRGPVLESAREAAGEEAEKARDRAEVAAAALEACGNADEQSELEAIVVKVREAGHDRDIAALERQHGQIRREFEDALQVLTPWAGSSEELLGLPRPDQGQITEWSKTLSALREERADLERTLTDRRDNHNRLVADIEALSAGAGDIDDLSARTTRDKRDEAWTIHRARLSQTGKSSTASEMGELTDSADAFEKTMMADDRVAFARIERASDIAKLRQVQADLIRVNALMADLEKKTAPLEEKQQAVLSQIESVMKAMHLPADRGVDFLGAWLEQRDAAIAKRSVLANAENDLEAARRARSNAADLLCNVMDASGLEADPEKPLDQLLAFAQARVDRGKQVAGEIRAAQKLLEDTNRDLAERQRTLVRADERLQAWQDEWSEALKDSWLAGDGGHQSPAGMREVLQTLADLAAKLEKRDELNHRILAMAADRKAYEDVVEALADETGETYSAKETLQIADKLDRRLSEAVRLRARSGEKQEELDQALETLRGAGEKLAAISARFREMSDRFPAETFADLLEKLGLARDKATLGATIAGKERDLTAILECESIADAEAILRETATDDEALANLTAERARAEQALDDLDGHVSGLFHEWKTAEKALASVDGDAAVARLEEERRTLLLDIEAQAERFLGLSIGAMVAESALQSYRDRHRNSMMRRAAAAFATITRGGFSDLTTTPGKSSEVLVGVRADGGSMIASEMSKGTRFQLYLALRIAGYAEFAERRTALPFFADDIMETFDDDRSAETFQLLTDMADSGQVIYLTHHRHLCDIARKVSGDRVTIHTLPDPGLSLTPAMVAE